MVGFRNVNVEYKSNSNELWNNRMCLSVLKGRSVVVAGCSADSTSSTQFTIAINTTYGLSAVGPEIAYRLHNLLLHPIDIWPSLRVRQTVPLINRIWGIITSSCFFIHFCELAGGVAMGEIILSFILSFMPALAALVPIDPLLLPRPRMLQGGKLPLSHFNQ